MNHCGTVTIETERLFLRRLTKRDALSAFGNWTNDEKVTQFLRWSVHESIDITENIFADWIHSYEQDNFYQWAIVLKSIDQPIGTIGAVDVKEHLGIVHIGYCIGSKWWHQGITSEAFLGIIPFFFEKVKVNRIESQHDPHNPNSGKVMEKCGLKYEGTLRQADISNKGIVDAAMYSFIASEYFKVK